MVANCIRMNAEEKRTMRIKIQQNFNLEIIFLEMK